MPRNGANVYAAPAGTQATTQTAIESAKYNAFVNDLVTDANAARPIVAGGTGATTAEGARSSLGATTVGDALFTAASEDAARTAIGAQASLEFTPVQQGGGEGQGTNKVYLGFNAGTGRVKVQVDATDLGDLAPASTIVARPATAGGAGEWVSIGAAQGASLTLPAGGQWAHFIILVNSGGGVSGVVSSVASGGAIAYGGAAGITPAGFAWRVS